ncbi:MAG: carbon-nitrogen hydrolase family protein [Chloroflexota bacterium]|nr:carbon-nitrogen hydrolase family protein [Chloroflexota bacterium]
MDSSQPLKVGVAQAAPVFLDREATTRRACELIEQAGREGVDLLGFPEGFIPTHPDWFHWYPASSARSFAFARRLYDNSVEIESPTTDLLRDAAARAKVNVVVGMCERLPQPDVSLFNTQLFIDSDGMIVGKHQKIMPTLGERVVHSRGSGDGLRVFTTPVGRVSGLICGENSNPLAVMTMAAGGTQLHVASWPSDVSRDEGGLADLIRGASQAMAYSMGAFVLSAQAVINDEIVHELAQTDEDARFLAGQALAGGSMIVAPNRTILAGPVMGPWEGVLTAEIDLKACVAAKLIHDYSGHYNRPDIFTLHVDRHASPLVVDGPWPGSRPMEEKPAALDGDGVASEGPERLD